LKGIWARRYLLENSGQLEVKRFVRPLYPSLEKPTQLAAPGGLVE